MILFVDRGSLVDKFRVTIRVITMLAVHARRFSCSALLRATTIRSSVYLRAYLCVGGDQ